MSTVNNLSNQNTATQNDGGEDLFVVGKGFHLVGTVRGSGLCVIDGSVDGALETENIKINSSGMMSGDLKCNRLDVAGRVQGTIEATEVVLRGRAFVEGKINYTTIAMERGVVVDAELSCTKVKAPRKEEPYFFRLPDTIVAKINLANNVQLLLADGTAVPDWIKLQNAGVSIDRQRLQEYVQQGGKRDLTLRIDGQDLTVNIP